LLGVFSILFLYLFIWIRITFSRFRYDLLIISAWKSYLPFSLSIFMLVCLFL
jgi:NADH:ubiquinone oxidoreductase subunit H